MNNYTIFNSTHSTSQVDSLEHVVHVGEADATFRVKIHADKSYSNQCRASVEMWTPAGWTELFKLLPDDWDARVIDDAVEHLLDRALDFLRVVR